MSRTARRPIDLSTPRLRLREFTLDDAPALYELVRDPEIVRFTGDPLCRDLVQAREITEFIMSFYESHGMGRLAMVLPATGELIGWCGIRPREGEDVDLGYRLNRCFWGQGYATEAARAVVDFGFERLELDLIVGRVDPANSPSERVLIKLGMRCAGEVVDPSVPSGRLRVYEISRHGRSRG